jgi:tetratricopeptide (TPR) repeat protein/tRNA A-37 threonylcarbamoyl transferase component Bud32
MSAEALLRQALALPPEQRTAFLDQVCAGQPALRAGVEALLQAQAANHVLELPTAELPQTGPYTGPAAAFAPPLALGSVFAGRYKIREKLGEGGMGVVYVADQTTPVQRRVALKIIKPGLDAARILPRFEQERQALALMDHPNIAKVLDAGVSETGQPYFVMELIKGVPLTRYCDEARLTVRQRLELFIPICQAVQHAHQKGIIHRDLKPSNLLVTLCDGKAMAKVIDFGVAKATGPHLTADSVYTEVGTMVGTLEYMSPEQAQLNNLDIDTRSDIYALGVLLYELLTGSVPFSRRELRSAAYDEMVRILKEVEPPSPSTRLSSSDSLPSVAAVRQTEPRKLTSLVKGDLDWIVMKCLEKDRSRRYETANGLALDLKRYLDDEPVLAGPPSTAYRLRKFVRRNKGPVVAAGLVLVALLVGMVGTTWGLVWANEARQAEAEQRALAEANEHKALASAAQEQAAKKAAEGERDRATQARDRTRQVLEQMTSEITGDSLATQTELSAEQKKFLTEVLQYYREFAGEKADGKEARERTAKAAFRVGLIESRLGLKEESTAAFRQGRDEYAKLAAEFPAVPAYREELANSHFQLALVLKHLSKPNESMEACRAALAVREKLAAEFPAEPYYRQEVARCHNQLGNLFVALGKPGAALEAHQLAQAMQKKLVAEFPAKAVYRQDLAKTHLNVGNLWNQFRKRDEALEAYGAALALYEKLTAEFPKKPAYRQELALTHNNLGVLFSALGKQGEALEFYRAALAVQEKLAAEFPAVPAYRQELALSHNNLGVQLGKQGKHAAAVEAFQAALVLQDKLASEYPTVPAYRQDLARSHLNLGVELKALGKREEALEAQRAALALRDKLAAELPAEPSYREELAASHHQLGLLLAELDKFAEALESHRAALALQEKLAAELPTAPAYRQEMAASHYGLGVVLARLGKPGEALAAHQAALALYEKLATEFPAVEAYRNELARSHHALGVVLANSGKRGEALAAYRAALAVREKLAAEFPAVPAYRQELATSHNDLGILLLGLGQPNEALQAYREGLALREKLVDEFPTVTAYRVDLGGSYCNIAHVIRTGSQPADSLDWYAKAIAALAPVVAKQPSLATARLYLHHAHWGRAVALGKLNRHAEALADWDQTVKLAEAKTQPADRAGRALAYIRAGKVDEAVAEVTLLTKAKGWSAVQCYNFACIYSLASAKDAARQQEYGQRAVALLRQAVQAGYKNVALLKKDPDLDPLRQREDFQMLLAELQK